jgi:hypothetical protein
LSTLSPQSQFSTKLLNEGIAFRFQDLKSPGTALLTSERNSRLLEGFKPGSFIRNFESASTPTGSFSDSLTTNKLSSPSLSALRTEVLGWSSPSTTTRLSNNLTTFSNTHTPLPFYGPSQNSFSFDKFNRSESDLTPDILKSKEESAPSHTFGAY